MSRLKLFALPLVLVLLAAGAVPRTASGQFLDTDKEEAPDGSGDQGTSKPPVPGKVDPVLQAFALPKGMVLSPDEMKFAKQVRSRLEPQLRTAYEHLEQAGDDKGEKLQAAKEIREVKNQIRAAINMILQQRAIKYAREVAKRRAQAREKARKRGGGKKKGGGKRRKRR